MGSERVEAGKQGRVDRRDRKAEPEPAEHKRDRLSDGRGRRGPTGSSRRTRGRRGPSRGRDDARVDPPQQKAAQQRTEGQRGQQPHQHESRAELGGRYRS